MRYVLGVFLRYALFLFVLPMFLLRLYAYFAGMAGSEAWARMVWKPLPLWLLGVPVLCAAIHVWRLRSRGIDLSRQDFKPVQAMEATVPTAQKPLFDRLRERMELEYGWSLRESDEQSGLLHFSKGVGLFGWGERMELSLSPEGEGQTRVRAVSRPRFRFTPLDGGNGILNLQQLRQALEL
jgi:hypothetical protein